MRALAGLGFDLFAFILDSKMFCLATKILHLVMCTIKLNDNIASISEADDNWNGSNDIMNSSENGTS